MTYFDPIPFDNSYVRLPERFYTRQAPTPVTAPQRIRVNIPLAQQLNLDSDWLQGADALAVFAGNRVASGSEPVATVYAGHQFGGWSPQLGDGRAVLLGEVIGRDGRRYDIQLKGAGRTLYSRGGDGRSPLGPVLREYIVSEAMAALGVPTTRSLAAVTTGETVRREKPLPGAVLTRVASSHIRIGTFQFFAARQDREALQLLADHVIARHYPAAAQAADPYLALLHAAIAAQAQLIAQWQSLGFIHGVMNTDNMLLSGETIDYGPCAFMDEFHPQTVYSSIDTQGRYAYRNQPGIAQWNLSWLAQSLMPLFIDATRPDGEDVMVELARTALSEFVSLYQEAYDTRMLGKLGLTQRSDENLSLLSDLLALMDIHGSDFTLTFRHLADTVAPQSGASKVDALITLPETFAPWLARWQTQLAAEPRDPLQRQRAMYAHNPVFIPRNHLIEEAIQAAQQRDDFAPFHELVDVIANPTEYDPLKARFAIPPCEEQRVTRTFCGT